MADEESLTKDIIRTPQGISAIGIIATSELLNHGQVTLWVNPSGVIELIPLHEVDISRRFPDDQLDQLPDEEAIRLLLSARWSDTEIAKYLERRANRE